MVSGLSHNHPTASPAEEDGVPVILHLGVKALNALKNLASQGFLVPSHN